MGFRSSIGANGTTGTNGVTWHSIGTPFVKYISIRGLRLFSLLMGLSTVGFRLSIGTNGVTWHSIGELHLRAPLKTAKAGGLPGLLLLLLLLLLVLSPAITERKCSQLDVTILALPVCLGGLGFGNPCLEASREYASSVKVTTPLVEQIASQSHEQPEDSLVKSAQQAVTRERSKELVDRTERIKEMAPCKTKRALNLAAEKGPLAWLTVLPLKDLGVNLNKRQFRNAVKLRYDWKIDDIPSTCACGKFLQLTTP